MSPLGWTRLKFWIRSSSDQFSHTSFHAVYFQSHQADTLRILGTRESEL